ncbi:MAG: type II secretion system protein M [Kiritimatiellales bacterium]|nr:type II secretion system protein M [Kiritimatiellales bacterium]
MKISKREMGLALMTLTVILIGFTWYIVSNRVEQWKGMKGEIAQIDRQVRMHQQAIKMSDSWKTELDTLQNGLAVFASGDHSVAPDLLKIIKQISSKHGLDITRTQPYPEKQIGDLFEMGINCTWQGTLEAIVFFLADLQEQGARFDVRSLNVAPQGKGNPTLKGNMVIHCAYMRSAAPTPEAK